ncbi:MAG TPA: amidohydrolase [Bacteroidia bacterium]|nr:amidohydrolase [Bacteroidia bacterium]
MKNLTVTMIQTSLFWENISENLKHFSEKIAAISEPTDLIVLPEMFNTGFSMSTKKLAEKTNGKTMQWMQEKAKEKNCCIVGSLIINDNENYYNRLIWVSPDGKFQTYDKRHLFRMGEENNFFSTGNKKIIVELKGWKICPLVCYDLRFPVWSRNINNYDCLLYVANWPERRNHHWKTLLQARAIENQCYVIGLNRIGNDGHEIWHSGDSAVIDSRGNTISKTKANEESIETITLNWEDLQKYRTDFPVQMDADDFDLKL